MDLFELKDYRLVFSPQALAVGAFKDLWDRDKSKDKKRANAELSFIYFYCDFKSDFGNILDDEERMQQIIINLSDLKDGWKIDKTVQTAIDFYKERQETVSTKLLDDARYAVKELSSFLRKVDLELLDDKGKPIYDAKKIADTISNLSKVVDSLAALEDRVKKEQDAGASMRGGRTKGMFEDGL